MGHSQNSGLHCLACMCVHTYVNQVRAFLKNSALTHLSAGHVTLGPLKHIHFDSYLGYVVRVICVHYCVFSLYAFCLHTPMCKHVPWPAVESLSVAVLMGHQRNPPASTAARTACAACTAAAMYCKAGLLSSLSGFALFQVAANTPT